MKNFKGQKYYKTSGVIFLILNAFISFALANEKRDIFWACDGKMVSRNTTPSSIEVRSSFYIGKDFVEQEGTRFRICEEQKTQLRFADDCKSPKTSNGKIDLILKTVQIDETLKKITPNTQYYEECRSVRNPRG